MVKELFELIFDTSLELASAQLEYERFSQDCNRDKAVQTPEEELKSLRKQEKKRVELWGNLQRMQGKRDMLMDIAILLEIEKEGGMYGKS